MKNSNSLCIIKYIALYLFSIQPNDLAEGYVKSPWYFGWLIEWILSAAMFNSSAGQIHNFTHPQNCINPKHSIKLFGKSCLISLMMEELRYDTSSGICSPKAHSLIFPDRQLKQGQNVYYMLWFTPMARYIVYLKIHTSTFICPNSAVLSNQRSVFRFPQWMNQCFLRCLLKSTCHRFYLL